MSGLDRRSYDPNSSVIISRVSSNEKNDDSLADVSMADVSMTDVDVNVLNDSSNQINANNTSMAGLSDSSAG